MGRYADRGERHPMHLAPLIQDLSVILVVAGFVSLLFQKLRQPVVLGYIIAGMLVSQGGRVLGPRASLISDLPNIRIWGEIGVIFLMFSLGLEFSFRKLAKVGPSAALTACLEVAFMFFAGYQAGRLFGWKPADCVFLGAMISVSSTTMIVKVLEELRLKTRRFSEMIFAILIVEDLIAILILVALTAFATQKSVSGMFLLATAARLVLVTGTWFLAGYFLVPRFIRYVGRVGSNEMLTLLSLGFCLSLAVLAAHFQYSVALGAFIMGSIFAESSESRRIEGLLPPLRDLFVAVFFVSVGMLIEPGSIARQWPQVLLVTVIVLAGKTVATSVAALLTGQTLRTSVQVGMGIAQIGEFSFIIAGLGMALGLTSDFLYPIAVSVSLLTAFTAPIMNRHSHRLAAGMERRLPMPIKEILVRYVVWTQARRADTPRKQQFYRLLLRWGINGILVSAIFVFCGELLVPWLRGRFGEPIWEEGAGWAISVLFSSPFIMGMLGAFRNFHFSAESTGADHAPRGGTLLLIRALSLVWIGLLGIEFFRAWIALAITVGLVGVLLLLFRRQIETSYSWFESRFLSAFEYEKKSRPKRDFMRTLAPWDAHLVRIKVHPNADLVGRHLAETELKSRHGISVVAIQRGLRTLVAPRPQEMIFPKDELLVLGTDEQIEKIRPGIERPPGLENRYDERNQELSSYELQPLRLDERSPLQGLSIRQSRIREDYRAMVVGIERDGKRLINPPSDTVLQPGDILWIVGEIEDLSRLTAAGTSPGEGP